MHVAIFHTTLPPADGKPGGVEVAVDRLAQALAVRPGVEVTVWSCTTPPPGRPYGWRPLFPRLGRLLLTKPGRWLLLPALLNVVDVTGVDVVHLHGDDWFYLRRRRPTVRTFAGSARRESQHATSWQRRLAFRALHHGERLARRLATVSCASDADATRLLHADRELGYGIDVTAWRPGPKAPVPTVLFVGTWAGRKRGQMVFRAFVDAVVPAIPAARLVMVSDHAEPHPAVTHLAAPDDEELAAWYRSAWVFAYPSTYEGFGLTYLEAMASGTAVLATPNTASHRFLGEGAGVVVDDDRFDRELVSLLRDPAARSRLETVGRRGAEAYSWEAVARAYVEVYEEAVHRFRARRPPRRGAADR